MSPVLAQKKQPAAQKPGTELILIQGGRVG
jgi:hypothetical protein